MRFAVLIIAVDLVVWSIVFAVAHNYGGTFWHSAILANLAAAAANVLGAIITTVWGLRDR